MSCSCTFETNEAVIDRVREKGMDKDLLPSPFKIECVCGNEFEMTTHVDNCPECNMVFGVTPCRSEDIENVVMSKVGY